MHMKKSYTLGLLAVAAVAMPASAQQKLGVFPAPSAYADQTEQIRVPFKAPAALDDKSKGFSIYAGEYTDGEKKRGWIHMLSGDTYNSFERLHWYYTPNDDFQMYGLRTGAFDGEKYYGLFTKVYTLTEVPDYFASVDIKTGVADTLYRYTSEEDASWPIIYNMTYNPADGLTYAFGRKSMGSYAISELYTVNTHEEDGYAPGHFEPLMDMDGIYYDFAFDMDGNMYAVGNTSSDGVYADGCKLVVFNSDLEKVREVACTKDGNPFVMSNIGTMSFNYTTGKLYWIAVYSGYNAVFELDTKTGVMNYVGGIQIGTWPVGMYIPYFTADSRDAAAQVSDLQAVAGDKGQTQKLSWTNPTKAWNQDDLSNLSEVRIYRKKGGDADYMSTETLLSSKNAELLATVPAQKGAKASWTDNAPEQGLNTYYVVPCRQAGELGVPDTVRCFAGTDVPGAVENASITALSTSIKLSWNAPSNGHYKGYIDQADLTYTVTRQPDGKVVAKDIKDTEFTDTELPETNNWYYNIQAKNSVGAGDVFTTNSVLVGPPLEVPFSLGFETLDDANRWVSVDNSYSGSSFSYAGWDGCDDMYKSLILYGSQYNFVDAWVFSPEMRLEKGKTYRFTYSVYNYYNNVEHNYIATIGRGQAVADTICSIKRVMYEQSETEYATNTYEATYTPQETGSYNFGFDVQAEGGAYDIFRFYGVKVEEIMENDLAAVSFTSPLEVVADTQNKATVNVRNMGSKAQNAYTVGVYCKTPNGDVLVGSTADVPSLAPNESADVNITYAPTLEGQYDFYAKVSLNGDTNASNDATATTSVNVQPAGTLPWTGFVTDAETECEGTQMPFQMYGNYDVSESIYLASELNLPAGSVIGRIGYEYRNNGDNLTERSQTQHVKIYMANTPESETVANSPMDKNAMTLVYEGDFTVQPGNNMLSFSLDEPFEYDNTKNLCIYMEREGVVGKSWPLLFRSYNLGGANRSLRYSDKTPYAGKELWADPKVPVLYYAIEGATGISAVNAAGSKTNAPVYNIGGQRVGNNLGSLKGGVYIQNGKKVVKK